MPRRGTPSNETHTPNHRFPQMTVFFAHNYEAQNLEMVRFELGEVQNYNLKFNNFKWLYIVS